jgi:hypothetical protein
VHAIQLHFFETEQPNLKLKTQPKQLLGSLSLDIAFPASVYSVIILSVPFFVLKLSVLC